MAIIGTYNGASIIAFPTSPGIKQLQVEMNDTVAVDQSPFTGSSQVQIWPGADFYTADLTLPQLTIAQAAVWTAFLAECRGMANVFYLGHPFYKEPSGTASGSPVVNGINAPMASVLNTRGWTPSAVGVLLPGDRLQIGYRLHVVLDQVNASSGGSAAISIWPSIREATADGDTLTLTNPQGLWRLADNKRTVLSAETRLAGVNFKLMEAR